MTINKILHTYWGAEKLSYLRYLTIISFMKYNPDWEVRLYTPIKLFKGNNTWATGEQIGKYIGKDYMNELPIKPIKVDMESIGMSNDIPEVHKSDILRYFLLLSYGGVWSDMDIIYTKPLIISSDIEHIVCKHPTQHYFSIGLIGSIKGSKMFKALLDKAYITATDTDYQVYGNQIWNGLKIIPKTWNIPMNLVYYLDSTMTPKIFEDNVKLPKESIGLHWYAGSPISSKWENRLTPDNYMDYDNTICNTIKQVMDNAK